MVVQFCLLSSLCYTMESLELGSSLRSNMSLPIACIREQTPTPYVSIAIATALIVSAATTLYFVHQDYCKFLSLGPGGTPSTWLGFLKIKLLGLWAINDPYMPPPIPPEIYLNRPAYLSKSELVQRKGARPIVQGIAPHRQLNQRPTSADFQKLRENIDSMGDRWPRRLRHGTSCLEKHGPGLFALQPINASRHCSGEVCHAHPSDGSMHLTLHPADAAIVILRGWGERHPLSSGGWLARFVPQGFCMVYAPRNEAEVEVVRKIVAAAVWWVGGVDVDEKFSEEAEEVLSVEESETRDKEMASSRSCGVGGFISRSTS